MVTEHKSLSPYLGREMVVQTHEGTVRIKQVDTCLWRRNHRTDNEKRLSGNEPSCTFSCISALTF